jgi:hypothetical protein
MANSSAEIFYRELSAEGANAFDLINSLITDGADENEWRDFKEGYLYDTPLQVKNPTPDQKDQQLKIQDIWSENLGAFSNSGGGLLIWGIKAPKRIAQCPSLCPNAEALAERLIELQNNAVEPPVQGVEVCAAVKPGSSAGFVICYIPNSIYSPHRSRWAKREYYMRSIDSNMPMRTEVLRRMFYPHTTPRLAPILRLSLGLGDDKSLHLAVSVKLKNYGSASAEKTYIELFVTADRPFKPHYDRELWTQRSSLSHSYECATNIHPGQEVIFLNNLSHSGGYERGSLPKTFSCKFRIFCQHAPAMEAVAMFTNEEILSAATNPIEREARALSCDS